jgi:hypothetical protein
VQPVPTVPTHAVHNFRRSVVLAAAAGGVGLLVTAIVGNVMMGVFGCVGLALGALNSLLVQRSVVRFAVSQAPRRKRRFTLSVLGRLGLVTVLALACALLVRPAGLGVFAGLAAFQLLMLGGASLPLVKEVRQS